MTTTNFRAAAERARALLIDAALFLLFLIALALAWAWREA
jgi:hypothetical protein